MEQRRTPGSGPSSYWLIYRRECERTTVLTLDVGGEDAVPIFSFEEEARLFWIFEAPGAEWHVRETTLEETHGLLLALRTQATIVVLDPLPTILGLETNLLLSLPREDFTRRLHSGRLAASPGYTRRSRCLRNPSTRRSRRGRSG